MVARETVVQAITITRPGSHHVEACPVGDLGGCLGLDLEARP
jgi:hypothetical protein